jgi:hypothetical protein
MSQTNSLIRPPTLSDFCLSLPARTPSTNTSNRLSAHSKNRWKSDHADVEQDKPAAVLITVAPERLNANEHSYRWSLWRQSNPTCVESVKDDGTLLLDYRTGDCARALSSCAIEKGALPSSSEVRSTHHRNRHEVAPGQMVESEANQADSVASSVDELFPPARKTNSVVSLKN